MRRLASLPSLLGAYEKLHGGLAPAIFGELGGGCLLPAEEDGTGLRLSVWPDGDAMVDGSLFFIASLHGELAEDLVEFLEPRDSTR